MNSTTRKRIEVIVHVLFWIFFFSAVNVDWNSEWFDKTIRTNTPSPLSVLIFSFIFYAHSLWAIPKYLNKSKWKTYIFSFILIFIFPEVIRSGLLDWNDPDISFWEEFRSRDSLVLGQPSVLWIAFTLSTAYRFTKDWFVKQYHIEHLGKQLSELLNNKGPVIQPLNEAEASDLQQKLEISLRENQLYLNQELSLAELAQQIDTSDKKLSTLLNQNLRTNFYDYINSFRIATFKQGVLEGKLSNLSIVGLAFQCGFKSKSSFYRAFKKETGMSPSQFIN